MSTLEIHFSLSMPISYHGQSDLLDPSGKGCRALPVFAGLYGHQMTTSLHDWAGLWSTFQAQFSTPFLHLCCMVLCLSPGSQTRTLVSAKCCPSSVWPLLQKHSYLSHRMLLPTILGWLHSCSAVGVWGYVLVPLSSRLLHEHKSCSSEPNLRKTKYYFSDFRKNYAWFFYL